MAQKYPHAKLLRTWLFILIEMFNIMVDLFCEINPT